MHLNTDELIVVSNLALALPTIALAFQAMRDLNKTLRLFGGLKRHVLKRGKAEEHKHMRLKGDE